MLYIILKNSSDSRNTCINYPNGRNYCVRANVLNYNVYIFYLK